MVKNIVLRVLLATIFILAILGSGAVFATPPSLVGSQVTNYHGIGGTNVQIGEYLSGDNVLPITLTGGNGAIINWSSLGIGSNQVLSIYFADTANNAAVLNRVTGSNVTQIAGAISSNGKVFLLNPNGIVFTDGAAINAASFVASTLPVSDIAFENYVNGVSPYLQFNVGSGNIRIDSPIVIDSGSVAFIANTVVAPGITFNPAVTLTSSGNNLVTFSDSSITLSPVITNPPPGITNPPPGITNPSVIQALTNTAGNVVTLQTEGTSWGAVLVGGVQTFTGLPYQTLSLGPPPPPAPLQPGDAPPQPPGSPLGLMPERPSSPPPGPLQPGGQTQGSAGAGSLPGGAPPQQPQQQQQQPGPSQPGGQTQGLDSSDRALSVVANPPPVQGVSHPVPRPPQTTTQLAQGLSQMTSGSAPHSGGVPGIRGDFSSSGNPGRW